MNPEPIDVTRIALRTLRFLDDSRRAVEKQWRDWTKPRDAEPSGPPDDPREPPQVW